MTKFLKWFAATRPTPGKKPKLDGLARAAMAHLWFETIHPFEDGNGRIGRAIIDMVIVQDQRAPVRLYSLSHQLLEARRAYYDALNQAQLGDGDVTAWVVWFAGRVSAACRRSGEVIDRAMEKSRFWLEHAAVKLNHRQRKVLQRLLDDGDGKFLGGLNAEKYIKMTQASKATATRDLAGLVAGHLLWTVGQGKGLRYYVNVPGWIKSIPPIFHLAGMAVKRKRGANGSGTHDRPSLLFDRVQCEVHARGDLQEGRLQPIKLGALQAGTAGSDIGGSLSIEAGLVQV